MEAVVVNDYASINGGSSFVAIASAKALARQGHPVTFFSAVGPVEPDLAGTPNLETICLGQDEILRDPRRPRAMVRGIWNSTAAAAFRRVLAGKDPAETVVHVHTFTKALSASVIDTALRSGFRVALTLHDFFVTCPTGGFFVHKDHALCHRTPLSLDCLTTNCDRRSYAHKIWRSARTILQNPLLKIDRRLTHFIGVSEHSVGVMRPFLPAGVPVTVVRNPVEIEDRGCADVAANTDLTYVGRFSPEKGPLLMAAALEGTDLPATFAGDGELLEEARRLAPGATFTGWLPADEVAGCLRRARALVFPPLWYETLGLVVIEAAAQGVPAIVSSRCAARDLVRDGETGLIFEHGSAASLRAAMRKMQDPEFAARLGREAHTSYWRDPWTPERHIQELLPVYRDMLSPRAGGAK